MSARIWTLEQKEQQRQAIRKWRPWEQSTGAITPEGKAKVATNAYKGGKRSECRMLIAEIRKEVKSYADYLKSVS